MEVVFDTRSLSAGRRRQAWRDAICEIYLQVDCACDSANDYEGLVREARYGGVTITDALISPQVIRRRAPHIGGFGKDCYYIGIEHIGAVDIRQAGASFVLRPGRGSLYYANEPYELHCAVKSRQFWIELDRSAFDGRFEGGRPPMLKHFDLQQGLGRIAADYCATLARECASVEEPAKARLGEQFMDVLALALAAEPQRQSSEPVVVTGLMRASEPRNWFTPADDPARGQWFTRDPVAIAAALKLARAAPFTIDADATGDPGDLPQGGETILAFPNNHLAYAFTWFGMALALAAVSGAFALTRLRGSRR